MAEKIHAGQGDYDRLVLADPDNATAWLIRGMYYNDAFGQYGEALRCYNRSLELDPASGPAWYAKGVALRNMQRFNESGTCFEQAGKYGFFEKP
jgi:tetratricopeptide (TPR) repeat protein